MTTSLVHIEKAQATWSRRITVDSTRTNYAATIGGNLFRGALQTATEQEFREGDGAELNDAARRPAKMRALASSSALAVNFFEAWRDTALTGLAEGLGLPASARAIEFEYKPDRYPVGPRSPNLDVLLTLTDGHRVGVESKFTEPFRKAYAAISPKYFPSGVGLWEGAELHHAQRLAERFASTWLYLDAPQLLKHMLGLASESKTPATLLYLWFDTGLEDADEHRREVETFAERVRGDWVAFLACTYQDAFAALEMRQDPIADWRDYMRSRYFS